MNDIDKILEQHIDKVSAFNFYSVKNRLDLIEIKKLSEKIKWDNRFTKSYKITTKIKDVDKLSKNAKFILIKEDDIEIGYLRIIRKYEFQNEINPVVYLISEAYIKPAYRNEGIFRQAVIKAIDTLFVKGICLSQNRSIEYYEYYESLGFPSLISVINSDMTFLVQHNVFEVVVANEKSRTSNLNLLADNYS